MANLVNYHAILTFEPRLNVLRVVPEQGIVRAFPIPMPVLGLRKHRTQSGQVWPRPETPQRDKLGVV